MMMKMTWKKKAGTQSKSSSATKIKENTTQIQENVASKNSTGTTRMVGDDESNDMVDKMDMSEVLNNDGNISNGDGVVEVVAGGRAAGAPGEFGDDGVG